MRLVTWLLTVLLLGILDGGNFLQAVKANTEQINFQTVDSPFVQQEGQPPISSIYSLTLSPSVIYHLAAKFPSTLLTSTSTSNNADTYTQNRTLHLVFPFESTSPLFPPSSSSRSENDLLWSSHITRNVLEPETEPWSLLGTTQPDTFWDRLFFHINRMSEDVFDFILGDGHEKGEGQTSRGDGVQEVKIMTKGEVKIRKREWTARVSWPASVSFRLILSISLCVRKVSRFMRYFDQGHSTRRTSMDVLG